MSRRIRETEWSRTASDGSTLYVVAHIDCDTAADLPGINDITGVTLLMGSTAKDISQNAEYEMQSDGTWVLQQSGTAAYTKAEIDAMIAAINAKDAEQQQEIDYSINTGSKNKLHTLRASGTSATGLTYTLNTDGTYTLGGVTTSNANISALCTLADLPTEWIGKNVTLTGAVDSSIRLSVYNGSTQTSWTDTGSGTEFELTAEMISNPYTVRLLVNSGTDCTAKVIKPMIRLSSVTDGSFEAYAPTNRELYLMIQAL